MREILLSLVLMGLLNVSRGQSGQVLPEGDIHFGVNISSWEEGSWELSGDIIALNEGAGGVVESEPGRRYTLAARAQHLMAAVENLTTPEVGLMHFSAVETAGEVAIEWISVPDRPLNYFLIQRSMNKKQWQDLGMVLTPPAKQPMTSYRYIDPYPNKGTNYYRLSQADTDAHIAQSEVIAVEMLDIGYHVMHIFPNSTLFGANISLHLESVAEVDIRLEDANGVEVGKIYAAKTRPGTHAIDIDLVPLPKGTYNCVIRVGDAVSVRELVK